MTITSAVKISMSMQAIHFSSLTALKIFNAVNPDAGLGLATPLTTAASGSFFLVVSFPIKARMKLRACVLDLCHVQQQQLLK